jgi:hypothetical protein
MMPMYLPIGLFLEPTFIGNVKTVFRNLPKPVAPRVNFFKVSLKVSKRRIFRHFAILRHVPRNVVHFHTIYRSFVHLFHYVSPASVSICSNYKHVFCYRFHICIASLTTIESYIHSNTICEASKGTGPCRYYCTVLLGHQFPFQGICHYLQILGFKLYHFFSGTWASLNICSKHVLCLLM